MKNLKILHQCYEELLLTAIPLLLLCSSFVLGEPGYLDFDNLPETKFTCAGKVIGGYYADLETSCQMFHVCTIGQLDEPMDIKFLCLNGTVFDQETRVCERVDEVDCSKSEKFYYLNLELYGNTMVPLQDEEITEESLIAVTTEAFISKFETPPVEQITITPTKTTPNSINIYTTMTTLQGQEDQLKHDIKHAESTFNTTNLKGKTAMRYSPSTEHPSNQLSQNHQQHQQYSFSTTHNPIGHINNSNQNSNTKEQHILENEEYEYDDEEDDSLRTAGYLPQQSDAHNLQKPSQEQRFSQHFIYQKQPSAPYINKNVNNNNTYYYNSSNNNTDNNSNHRNNSNNKNHNDVGSVRTANQNSAISFQRQQLQDSDPHSVTVTTHPVGYQKEQTVNKYGYDSQMESQQIPLSRSSIQQFQPSPEYSGLHLLPQLRLRGHGFQFSQHYPSQIFNGYGKTSPEIPLQLPFEHSRNQNQLLGFENNSADDLINIQKERKDLKRSDTPVPQSQLALQVPTTPTSPLNATEIKISNNDNKITQHQLVSRNSNIQNNYNFEIKQIDNFHDRNNSSTNFNNNENSNVYNVNISNISINKNNIYDKVLLTPQNRYIPTLPKIIITASASVSDDTGKKLNYSLGNVLGKTIKVAPSTYDEYKEEDVALDPFFLDVPKLRQTMANRK